MNYNINHISIMLGILVVIASIITVLFDRKDKLTTTGDYIMKSLNQNKDEEDALKELIDEKNTEVMYEINKMKEKLFLLTKQIDINEDPIINGGKKTLNNGENFKHIINYKQFVDKNQDIMDLIKREKSPEEIARLLDKSVREVEMVIKLIK